jgi:ATP-binding protein involved in chromosome partitioning
MDDSASGFLTESLEDCSMSVTETIILEALKVIQDPDLGKDIVTLGFVKNIFIDGGKVRFSIELTTPACPVKERFRREAEKVVQALEGVTDVQVTMTSRVRSAHALPSSLLPQGVKNIVAVASGKGGVGKSTVTCNLALALAATGASVGVLDADVYGPSIPKMLGETGHPPIGDPQSHKMLPYEKHGLKFMSMAMLTENGAPLLWRGPMASKVVQQFLGQVEWGTLDYLLIDLPPGTGDIHLTLTQSVPLSGAVLVTTPQEVAREITQKGLQMFQQVKVPILGIVENMSGFTGPDGKVINIFGKGGGRKMAAELNMPFLGEIPIDPQVVQDGDSGIPVVLAHPEAPASSAYISIAEEIARQLALRHETTDSTTLEPSKVDLSDPVTTLITWSDGKTLRYPNRFLRSQCPCANCVDEDTGHRILQLEQVDPQVRVTAYETVGRYAIQFAWSDGHSTGLYPFESLRKLGE